MCGDIMEDEHDEYREYVEAEIAHEYAKCYPDEEYSPENEAVCE